MTPVPSSLPPRLRSFPSRKSHAVHTVSNGYVPRNGLRRGPAARSSCTRSDHPAPSQWGPRAGGRGLTAPSKKLVRYEEATCKYARLQRHFSVGAVEEDILFLS